MKKDSCKREEKMMRWAYQKWCEGFSVTDIAGALDVDPSFIYWQFRKRKWKRVRIPLVYEEEA